jgi:hypothetical protein
MAAISSPAINAIKGLGSRKTKTSLDLYKYKYAKLMTLREIRKPRGKVGLPLGFGSRRAISFLGRVSS